MHFVNQNSIFGILYIEYTTAQSCRDFCVSVPSCVAVDFDYNDDTCWVHTNPAALLPENVYSSNNVTQSRIDRSCVTVAPGRSKRHTSS